MSIRGIDTQIMIARTAELSKDASAIQRHPQAAQENLAARTLAESTENLSRVMELTESEMENIRTDADGGNSGGGGGGSREQEEEEEMTEEQRKELLVAPAAHEQLIDIMI